MQGRCEVEWDLGVLPGVGHPAFLEEKEMTWRFLQSFENRRGGRVIHQVCCAVKSLMSMLGPPQMTFHGSKGPPPTQASDGRVTSSLRGAGAGLSNREVRRLVSAHSALSLAAPISSWASTVESASGDS